MANPNMTGTAADPYPVTPGTGAGSRAGAYGEAYGNQPGAQQKPQNSRIMGSANSLAGFVSQNSVEKGSVVDDRSGSVYSQWPVRLGAPDPYDQYADIRSQVVKQGGVVPGQGLAVVGDDYFQYVSRKQDMYQYAKFKSWFLSQIDLSSPEKAAYWKEKAPQIYQERRELYMKQMELTNKLTKIQMLGPEDEDDYKLIWMIQQGMITLPSGPAWAPQSMPKEQDFIRGMFSVKRIAPEILGDTQVKTKQVPWSSPLTRGDQNVFGDIFSKPGAEHFFGSGNVSTWARDKFPNAGNGGGAFRG